MKIKRIIAILETDIYFKIYMVIIGLDEIIKLHFHRNIFDRSVSIVKISYTFCMPALFVLIDSANNARNPAIQKQLSSSQKGLEQNEIMNKMQAKYSTTKVMMNSKIAIIFILLNNIILIDTSQTIFQQFYFQFIIKIWLLNLILISFLNRINFQVLLCILIFIISILATILQNIMSNEIESDSLMIMASHFLNVLPLHFFTLLLICRSMLNMYDSKLQQGINQQKSLVAFQTQFNEQDQLHKLSLQKNLNFTTIEEFLKEQKDANQTFQQFQQAQNQLVTSKDDKFHFSNLDDFKHCSKYFQQKQCTFSKEISLEIKPYLSHKLSSSHRRISKAKNEKGISISDNQLKNSKFIQENTQSELLKTLTDIEPSKYPSKRRLSDLNKYYRMNEILNNILDGLSQGVIMLNIEGIVEFANFKAKELLLDNGNIGNSLLAEVLMSQSNALYDKIVKNESSGTFDMVPSNLFLDELSLEDQSYEDDKKSIKQNFFKQNKKSVNMDQQKYKTGVRSLNSINTSTVKVQPKFSTMREMFESLLLKIQRFQIENDIFQCDEEFTDEDYEHHKTLLSNMWQTAGLSYKILVKRQGKKTQKQFWNRGQSNLNCNQNNYTRGIQTQQTINTFSSNYNNNNNNNNILNFKRIIEISISPLLIRNKVLVLCTIRDVSHFNQIRILKAVSQNKSNMLNQVSHEIRNPLSCMIEILTNLKVYRIEKLQFCQHNQRNKKDKNQEDMMNIAISSAQLLKNLLNDLLDMAQVSSGKFKLHQEQFSLFQVIVEIKKMMEISAEIKQNKIILEIEDDPAFNILSDQYRIRQIIINLVSNAIKYTTKGKIFIGVKKMRESEYLKVYVKDTGVGIKPDQKNKLFKAFEKIDDNRDLNPQGVGLGLVISNILAKNLFGYKKNLNIYFKSGIEVQDWESGTEFSFIIFNLNMIKKQASLKQLQSLQLNQDSQNNSLVSDKENSELNNTKECLSLKPVMSLLSSIQTNNMKKQFYQQQTKDLVVLKQLTSIIEVDCLGKNISKECGSSNNNNNNNIKSMNVIIVDDNPFNVQVLEQQILRSLSQDLTIRIEKAFSGEECLQIILSYLSNNLKVDLIFMDQEMPGLTGEQTATQAYQLAPQIPICFCTGNTNVSKSTPNVIHQLIKPITQNDLITIFKRFSSPFTLTYPIKNIKTTPSHQL